MKCLYYYYLCKHRGGNFNEGCIHVIVLFLILFSHRKQENIKARLLTTLAKHSINITA